MLKRIWQWFGFGNKKVSDNIHVDIEVSTEKALRQIEGVREAADKLQVSLDKLRSVNAEPVNFDAAIRHPNYNVDGTQRNIICSDGQRVPIPPAPPRQVVKRQRTNSSGSAFASGGTVDTSGDFLMDVMVGHSVGTMLQSEDAPTRSSSVSSSAYDSGLGSSSSYSSSFSGGSSDSYSGSSDSGSSSDW